MWWWGLFVQGRWELRQRFNNIAQVSTEEPGEECLFHKQYGEIEFTEKGKRGTVLLVQWFLSEQHCTTQAMAINHQKHVLGYPISFIWLPEGVWIKTIRNRITVQYRPNTQARHCNGVWTGQILHAHHQIGKKSEKWRNQDTLH